MSRVLTIITFALFLMNCQSTPVGEIGNEDISEVQQKENNQPNSCLTNNESDECTLVLETINYALPDLRCDPYELVVDIETSFFTPAGLGDGSTSRIDWEFFPNGNAGFWITDLEKSIPPNSKGSSSMAGCFSFGDQTTLRIKRTIIDHLGNISNELSIDVEDPNRTKIAEGTKAEFEFYSIALNLD